MVDFSTLPDLSSEAWQEYDRTQRRDALQALEDAMAAEQNRDSRYIVGWEAEARFAGRYSRDEPGIIRVNELYLNGTSPRECVDIIAHEGRHAYQHDCVRFPDQHPEISEETRQEWAHNFDNYIRYDEDQIGYFEQPIEVDARQTEQQVLAAYDAHQAERERQRTTSNAAPAVDEEWQRNVLQNIQESDQRQAKPLTAEELAEQEAKKKSATLGL